MEEENKKEKEGASFSMQVKEELSYVEGASRHCQLAELAALVLCCGRLVDKKMDDDKNSCINKTLLFESENETVLRKYFTFVQKTFNIELMRVHKGNGYALELNEQDTKTVLQAIELSEGEPLENCVADSRLLLLLSGVVFWRLARSVRRRKGIILKSLPFQKSERSNCSRSFALAGLRQRQWYEKSIM